MAFTITNFYVQTGATRSDILPSVVSFEARVGLVPDPGSMTAKLVYPTLDTAGGTVTIAKGMTIWMYYYQATPTLSGCVPFAGIITDLRQDGESIVVTAESLLAPVMRSTYTKDYDSSITAMDIIQEIVAAYTPAEPYLITASDSIYRATTGGASVGPISDITVDDCEFVNTPVGSILQYFCELPAFSTLTSILCSVSPEYSTNIGTGKANINLIYRGYGHHRLAELVLDHDSGLLSSVEWSDSTDTILNDVTVTIKGGAEYQETNAASIAAYGQRETKIFRPMYYTDTTYAQKHADTMVAALKDPKYRCAVDVDQDAVFVEAQPLNIVYTVTDDVTGKSEEMVLRSYTLRYPSGICSCVFDNAALNLANYGIRLENRVSNLESNLVTAHSGFYDLQGGQSGQYYHLNQAAYNNLYQQDQTVKTTSSPTFSQVISGTRPTIQAVGAASSTPQWVKSGYFETNSASYVTAWGFVPRCVLSSAQIYAKLSVNAGTGYARVYINGVAVGSEISITATSYTNTFLGTFYQILPGDTIDVMLRRGTSNWSYSNEASVCFVVLTSAAEFT